MKEWQLTGWQDLGVLERLTTNDSLGGIHSSQHSQTHTSMGSWLSMTDPIVSPPMGGLSTNAHTCWHKPLIQTPLALYLPTIKQPSDIITLPWFWPITWDIGWGFPTVVHRVENSLSNHQVASSNPCRSVLEQDTKPPGPDVHCTISVNVKCVYILVSRLGLLSG